MIHPDDEGFTYSSEAEWDSAAALELGADNPQRAWVLTDRDVWYANPFYKGPPVRHPEDDDEGDGGFALVDLSFVDDFAYDPF